MVGVLLKQLDRTFLSSANKNNQTCFENLIVNYTVWCDKIQLLKQNYCIFSLLIKLVI